MPPSSSVLWKAKTAVRHERVNQVRDVNHNQNNGDAQAERLVATCRGRRLKAAFRVMEERRHEEPDHGKNKETGEQTGSLALETLVLAIPTADHNCEPETEQTVADD